MPNFNGHHNVLAFSRSARSNGNGTNGKKDGAAVRHARKGRAILQEIKMLMEPFASLRDWVLIKCSDQSSCDRAEVADFTIDTDGEIKMYVNPHQSEDFRTIIRVDSNPLATELNELQRQSLLSLLAYIEKKALPQ